MLTLFESGCASTATMAATPRGLTVASDAAIASLKESNRRIHLVGEKS